MLKVTRLVSGSQVLILRPLNANGARIEVKFQTDLPIDFVRDEHIFGKTTQHLAVFPFVLSLGGAGEPPALDLKLSHPFLSINHISK